MPPAKQSRGRGSWGAPRRADHRTGANPAFACAVASALPGASVTRRGARRSFAVGERVFATVDDRHVVLRGADGAERRLELYAVGRDELRGRIEETWRDHAPKRLVTTYDRRRAARARERRVTPADIRRIIRVLPGATEGPIWGQDPGFLIGTEKKTRFARFGPPEASRVGNLLPPDDEGTLVIFYCEHKPELLASSADRFFTTPHYGAPDEPGGVITRLSEHRGDAELRELAELLEDAWRAVAPAELIMELDRQRERSGGGTTR
jgi:hypothetical protein